MVIMATFIVAMFPVASVQQPSAPANNNDMATCTDQHTQYSIKCFPFILPFP
jgi:hypothetical protein